MAEARILYIATDDGLIQFANPGHSDRWREVGRALQGQPVRVVAAAPTDPLLIVAATADAVHRTVDGGFGWQPIWHGEATALAFDAGGTLYVGTAQGALLRSTDDGQWEARLRANEPIKRAMVVGEQIVCCSAERVYTLPLAAQDQITHDSGATNIGVVADPSSGQALVIGVRGAAQRAFTGAVVILGGADPVLLVGTDGALLRSADGAALVPDDANGAAFIDVAIDQIAMRDVDGPQNVSALVNPPRFIDQIFATTKSGELWFSSNRGRTWMALRTGLPATNDLAFARAR